MDCLLLHVVFYKLHAGVLIFQVVGQDIILVIEGLSAHTETTSLCKVATALST